MTEVHIKISQHNGRLPSPVEFKLAYVRAVLEQSPTLTNAALRMGMDRRTLQRMLEKEVSTCKITLHVDGSSFIPVEALSQSSKALT